MYVYGIGRTCGKQMVLVAGEELCVQFGMQLMQNATQQCWREMHLQLQVVHSTLTRPCVAQCMLQLATIQSSNVLIISLGLLFPVQAA